jgi:hypothetical protein
MTQVTPPGHALQAIGWAGLACGVLDITAAFLTWGFRGVRPDRLLQGIATGLLGTAALNGGWLTALLGACCHFLVAFTAATVFYLASRLLPILVERPFVFGPLYGIAVYGVMYWVVIPLSRSLARPFSWSATILAVVTHIVCVGTPIALAVRHYSR